MNQDFLKEAINLSKKSIEIGGGPFGAVVVKNGEIIGIGMNKVVTSKDPTAHAEIVAIRDACSFLKSHELNGCELYSSCEPCPMCLGAIYWARIEKLYFSNSRKDAEEIGFSDKFIYDEIKKEFKNRNILTIQISDNESKKVFEEWKKKKNKIMY